MLDQNVLKHISAHCVHRLPLATLVDDIHHSRLLLVPFGALVVQAMHVKRHARANRQRVDKRHAILPPFLLGYYSGVIADSGWSFPSDSGTSSSRVSRQEPYAQSIAPTSDAPYRSTRVTKAENSSVVTFRGADFPIS